MEFPDYGLVKLAPRDLTGPGVEFFARRISNVGAAASVGASLLADQTSAERLYMLSAAVTLLPGAGLSALQWRWYISLPAVDVQIYSWMPGFVVAVDRRSDSVSQPIVIPGGQVLLIVGDFSGNVNPNTTDVWLTGYSFPKGNVLSY